MSSTCCSLAGARAGAPIASTTQRDSRAAPRRDARGDIAARTRATRARRAGRSPIVRRRGWTTARAAAPEGGNGDASATEDAASSATTTTTSPSPSSSSSSSSDCPYTALNDALGGVLPTKSSSKVPPGGPTMLPSRVFFESLLKAGTSPVGMPEAMLEWTAMTGEETVGIKNAIGPLCVSTVDPDVVEYVCHTNAKNYRLRMLPDAFRYVIKNKGITGSDGAYNREHRLMCQKPFMNAFSLEQFSVKVEERVAKLCDAWEKAGRRDGSLEVDVDDHSQRLTLDIVTSLAFNKDFKQVEGIDAQLNGGPKPDDTIISKVLDAYNDTSEIMGELFITPVPILRLQNFLGVGRVRELKRGYAILEDVGINHIIGERREQLEENARNGDDRDYCLLDSLLRATDAEGNPLPQEDVWGDVNDIMAAGHRTTASNLTVNLHHLARMTDIQRKVAEEVAKLGGRPPTFADVQDGKLQYTQRVVKESLRKYAPINLFPRLVDDADVLPTGHEVKPGDFILLSSWAMGRNPRVWSDPNAFDPDRFTEENLRLNAERLARESAGADADPEELRVQIERMKSRITAGRDFTYTPFGSGPRSCIGGTFALLATTVSLASVVQRFEFSVAKGAGKDPGFEIPFFYDTTITFPRGVHVTATPRDARLGAEEATEREVSGGVREGEGAVEAAAAPAR